MPKLEDLIDAVNSVEFVDAAEKIFYLLSQRFDLKDYDRDLFVSYLKASFVIEYKISESDTEKEKLIMEASVGGIYPEDAYWIFDTLSVSKAKIGQVINEVLVKKLRRLNKYINDSRYETLSKKDDVIREVVKEVNGYYTIDEIKSGNYIGQANYRLSEEEIKALEYTKMTACLNKIIHDLYDERRIIGYNICSYDEIEEDNVLKKFDFHTNKTNPEFEIIFDDESIIRYRRGDIKVKPYTFDDIIKYVKLYIIDSYEKLGEIKDEIIAIKDFDNELLKEMVCMVVFELFYDLDELEDVYTKKMIDASKKELDKVKRLCKKYNL